MNIGLRFSVRLDDSSSYEGILKELFPAFLEKSLYFATNILILSNMAALEEMVIYLNRFWYHFLGSLSFEFF